MHRRASRATRGWPAGIGRRRDSSAEQRRDVRPARVRRRAPGLDAQLVAAWASASAAGPSGVRVAHQTRPARTGSWGRPGPCDSGASVRRRSSGPVTVGSPSIDGAATDPIWSRTASQPRQPRIHATVRTDVRRLGSSRVWRSSPPSPWSPSPVRSARWAPAPSPAVDPDLFQRSRSCRFRVGRRRRSNPPTQGPGQPGPWTSARCSSSRLCEPSRHRLRFDMPSTNRPPARSARTSGVTTRTSRGTARASTAMARRAARP